MDSSNDSNYSNCTSLEQLQMIDVSKDSILSLILNDATDIIRYGDRPAYYSVCMNRYKKGTIIRIIRSKKDTFDNRPNILGYAFVNDRPIIFYEGVTNYKLRYSSTPNPFTFKLGKFDYLEDAEDVKYYYILDDVYARFSPEAGWIWSDGKPDE